MLLYTGLTQIFLHSSRSIAIDLQLSRAISVLLNFAQDQTHNHLLPRYDTIAQRHAEASALEYYLHQSPDHDSRPPKWVLSSLAPYYRLLKRASVISGLHHRLWLRFIFVRYIGMGL